MKYLNNLSALTNLWQTYMVGPMVINPPSYDSYEADLLGPNDSHAALCCCKTSCRLGQLQKSADVYEGQPSSASKGSSGRMAKTLSNLQLGQNTKATRDGSDPDLLSAGSIPKVSMITIGNTINVKIKFNVNLEASTMCIPGQNK